MSNIEFSEPKVFPKVILSKGKSGMFETFKRDAIMAELRDFVKPAPVEDLVALFIARREESETAEERRTNWQTVVGFLGRMMNTTPMGIPPTVGVAFWAQVVIATMSRDTN